MQSMNPAIPCQAAAEANEEGSLCVGKFVLRLLSVLPRALPLLGSQKEKKQGAFKDLSSRVGREARRSLRGQQGIQNSLQDFALSETLFPIALSRTGCARDGGVSCSRVRTRLRGKGCTR